MLLLEVNQSKSSEQWDENCQYSAHLSIKKPVSAYLSIKKVSYRIKGTVSEFYSQVKIEETAMIINHQWSKVSLNNLKEGKAWVFSQVVEEHDFQG